MLKVTPQTGVSEVKRSMRVDELMQPVVWDTFPEESLADAAARMRDHGVGSLAVIDDALVGILTERDVLRAVAENRPPNVTPVSALMTQLPVVTSPGTDTTTAARLMVEHDIRHLPVVADQKVVGMISARDLLVLETSA
jgi:CBS domain-containing protein